MPSIEQRRARAAASRALQPAGGPPRKSALLAATRKHRVEARASPPPPGVGWTAEERQLAKPGPWRAFDSSRVRDGRWVGGLDQIQVHFVDGTPWTYEKVDYDVWRRFTRSASPGAFVTRVLDGYPYHRGVGF